MPTDSGVDEGNACSTDGAGECKSLLERASTGDEVQHGEAVNQNEVFSKGLARALHDLNGETHSVFV